MATFNMDRAFLEVGGEERASFLQGLITQDVALLGTQPLLFAAMLSPQGKLAHDFFLFLHNDTIILDTPASGAGMLLKRLAMYKLRAKVTLRDATADWSLFCGCIGGIADPRHPDLPTRLYQPPSAPVPEDALAPEAYHRARIGLGVPDSTMGDATENDVAMDLGYDLLNAISFSKGCYVGQEVTARMHYKNIARRGFYIVEGAGTLPAPGTPVKAGELTLGTLRGSIGAQGLALLKFAEMAEAEAKTLPLSVENMAVRATAPAWLAPKLARFREAQENQ